MINDSLLKGIWLKITGLHYNPPPPPRPRSSFQNYIFPSNNHGKQPSGAASCDLPTPSDQSEANSEITNQELVPDTLDPTTDINTFH